MSDLDDLTKLLLELPEASVRASIHATEHNARAILVAAERALGGELPEPSPLNASAYTVDVGRATIFLPASFVEEEPEPRPEPKVRPMADLLAGA
jgi:hypothetical protein